MKTKFFTFIAGLGLRHFTASELWPYFSRVRNGAQNSIPPESLWPNMAKVLKRADELRENLGEPITILSSYRSPDYNKAISGASRSRHCQGDALDLTCKNLTKLKKLAETQHKNHGGGLGFYPNFVHIDTRNGNARW